MSDWYFKQDVERLGGRLGIHRLDAEQQQGPGPVERFRHRRRLFQLQIPDGAHDADHLIGERLRDAGHPGEHDLLLPLEVGIVDVQEQAATLEGLGQLPGVVGGQEHQRNLGGAHRPQLGDRYLVVGEDLQQQGLGLHLDPVHLVDEQHDRFVGPDGLQQGPGQQERLREDVLLDVLPVVAAGGFGDPLGLDAQQLLLVVPLVEGLGLVEPLVALQADQAGIEQFGDRLGQLGLAGAGGALDQDRLPEPLRQVHDAGDALVGQIADTAQSLTHQRRGTRGGTVRRRSLVVVLLFRSLAVAAVAAAPPAQVCQFTRRIHSLTNFPNRCSVVLVPGGPDTGERALLDHHVGGERDHARNRTNASAGVNECDGRTVAVADQCRPLDAQAVEEVRQDPERLLVHVADRPRFGDDRRPPVAVPGPHQHHPPRQGGAHPREPAPQVQRPQTLVQQHQRRTVRGPTRPPVTQDVELHLAPRQGQPPLMVRVASGGAGCGCSCVQPGSEGEALDLAGGGLRAGR